MINSPSIWYKTERERKVGFEGGGEKKTHTII